MTSDCRCCVCSTCPFHGLCLAGLAFLYPGDFQKWQSRKKTQDSSQEHIASLVRSGLHGGIRRNNLLGRRLVM